MKTRFDKVSYPLYCDAGPHEGDMRIDLMVRLYLSPQEYASYEGAESLRITLGEPVAAGGSAEPSTRRPGGGGQPPRRPVTTSASTAKEHRDGRP